MKTAASKYFIGFKFIFLTHSLYFTFDAVALWRQTKIKNAEKDVYGFTITFIWVFAYLWVIVIMLNLWIKRADTCAIFDQLAKLDMKSQSKMFKKIFFDWIKIVSLLNFRGHKNKASTKTAGIHFGNRGIRLRRCNHCLGNCSVGVNGKRGIHLFHHSLKTQGHHNLWTISID